jgi:hypothetical protein
MVITTKDLVDNLPPGLDRAVLRVIGFHTGIDSAISRADLVSEVARMGFKVHERVLRLTINQLRKRGHLICSTGGSGGGYFVPANWEELQEYLSREVHARAMDLLEQEKALRESAEKRWGMYANQGRLF